MAGESKGNGAGVNRKRLLIEALTPDGLTVLAQRIGVSAKGTADVLRARIRRSERATPQLLVRHLSSPQLRDLALRLGYTTTGGYTKLIDVVLYADPKPPATKSTRSRFVRRAYLSIGAAAARSDRSWRLPGRGPEAFLDVETDWHRQLTVVGFASKETGFVQLVGAEITRRRLSRELPARGRLFTFNGARFDLSVIQEQLRLNLYDRFTHCDLMGVCGAFGLRGGQKAVEAELGFRRQTNGMDGRDAIRLWEMYQRGVSGAIERLKAYNEDDVRGLEHIRERLKLQHRVL